MAIARDTPAGVAAPTTDRTTKLLIAVAVAATVFNDIFGLLPVGELSKDAFVYIFPLLALQFFRSTRAIEVPVFLTLIALVFLATMLVGVIENYAEIERAYFKGRTGMSRVATQGMTACFGLAVTLIFYNFAVQGHLDAILRGARWAVLVMAGVGVMEVASWYAIPGITQLYAALSILIHADTNEYYALRLRATAFEASWAAVMLTFIFPFAIAGAGRRAAPVYLALVVAMMLLAQSRTAMLVIGSQLLLLFYYHLRSRADLLVHVLTVACLGLVMVLLIPGTAGEIDRRVSNIVEFGSMDGPIDVDGGDENVSNTTRLAAIRAGLVMAREQPLLGVGLGQYGFNYPGAIQAGDLRSWEVRNYVSNSYAELAWPPSYSIHVRLLAETGLLGYAAWLTLVMVPLLRSLRNAGTVGMIERAHLAVALTLTGWLLLGVSIDSFRFFGGWIALGVAWSLPSSRKKSRRHRRDTAGAVAGPAGA